MNLKEIATEYYKSGLSVLPIRSDGTKKPPEGFTWANRQTERIEPSGEFKDGLNIAVVGGIVSGVECLDFDLKYDTTNTIWDRWWELVNSIDSSIKEIVTIQRTPSGGYHCIYKASTIKGNTKLANNEKHEVLIETRGEKGYFLVSPSKGYELLQGSFTDIKKISDEQHDVILTASRSFNEFFEVEPEPFTPKKGNSLSPWEDFNNRGDIESLLVNHGWVYKKDVRGNRMYLRPGGTQEWSAGYHPEKRLLKIFTTSTNFGIDKAYTPTNVYKILNNITNPKELAFKLKSEGYGVDNTDSSRTSTPPPQPDNKNDFSKFIVSSIQTDEYLESVRNGTFVMGLSTGFPTLDDYLRIKRGNFNITNGIDNTGKSIVIWYLKLLQSKLYGFRHIIYSGENKAGFTRRKLIEFYWCKRIHEMTDKEFKEAKDFINDFFKIIDPDAIYPFQEILDISAWLLSISKYDSLLIDPYNALSIDLANESKFSTHEYHYRAASELRVFAKRNDIIVDLNCHAITMATRQKDNQGYPQAPGKADTEGGGKFPNRADDFVTVHRLTQHPEKWMETQIHVRKVKEIETGGQPTPHTAPVILKMVKGFCGFEDVNGFNPILQKESVNKRYEPKIEDDEPPF